VPERPPDGPVPAFCFARTGVFEIEVGGRKLVGSAQRRQGDSFLPARRRPARRGRAAPAHAVPTTRDPLATLTTLEAALGRRPSFDEVADASARGLREEHGLDLRPGVCRRTRRARGALVTDRYASPAGSTPA
jgi:lipoate-protein ligase A